MPDQWTRIPRSGITLTLPNNQKWKLPKPCQGCGKPITRPPYCWREGANSRYRYYHMRCYTIDSLPKNEKRDRYRQAG